VEGEGASLCGVIGPWEGAPNFVIRVFGVEPGYTVFVPPMEEHQFTNTGHEVLRFVCLIPLLEQS
jgi:oxalate decarboxylase/phosphoglucose isomerase-like protein (cupin superfamily)